ncbi:MAG TPA: hypothetical protein VGM23_10210, partial [Armatimonadota bacterium]
MTRWLGILALLTLLFTAAWGQQMTLSLSECPVALKVTDPERQLTTFKPILDYLDGLQAKFGSTSTQPRLSAQIREGLTGLKQVPGVNMKGDFWVVLPTMPAPPAPPAEQPPAKDGVTAPAPRPTPTVYLIVPLSNPDAFRAA